MATASRCISATRSNDRKSSRILLYKALGVVVRRSLRLKPCLQRSSPHENGTSCFLHLAGILCLCCLCTTAARVSVNECVHSAKFSLEIQQLKSGSRHGVAGFELR